MSQPKLGELTGFSRDDIANFERGGTGAGSLIDVSDAMKCYEALATEDKTGNAISAALSVATYLVGWKEHDVKEAKQHLEKAREHLKRCEAEVRKCKDEQKRLRGLKNKSFPRYCADERFLVSPFPTAMPVKDLYAPGGRFNPLR
jgi:hypothetical protein